MDIKFSFDKEARFPYKADYRGYATVPICARIGFGGVIGRHTRTHSQVLELILGDLRNCQEKINPTYTKEYIDAIGPETKKVTDLSFRLLNDYNKLGSAIDKNFEAVLKLKNLKQKDTLEDYKTINFPKKSN
jgi:hypothetical protein